MQIIQKMDIEMAYRDATFASQILFSFFRWIWIAQMAVEIFVQNFGGLFAEVTAFSPSVQET